MTTEVAVDVRTNRLRESLTGSLMQPGFDAYDALREFRAALGRPEWHQLAACRGHGPKTFFSATEHQHLEARVMCERCPVSAECLDAGIGTTEGIWGGMTSKERAQTRRRAANGGGLT